MSAPPVGPSGEVFTFDHDADRLIDFFRRVIDARGG